MAIAAHSGLLPAALNLLPIRCLVNVACHQSIVTVYAFSDVSVRAQQLLQRYTNGDRSIPRFSFLSVRPRWTFERRVAQRDPSSYFVGLLLNFPFRFTAIDPVFASGHPFIGSASRWTGRSLLDHSSINVRVYCLVVAHSPLCHVLAYDYKSYEL